MYIGTCYLCELLDAWRAWLYEHLQPPRKKVVQSSSTPVRRVSQQLARRTPRPDVELAGLSIVEVCNFLDIALDDAGRGSCPLCNHASPTAFVVTERLGRFWCSGHCQNGGDAVELVVQLRQLSKPEAARWLSEQLGPP